MSYVSGCVATAIVLVASGNRGALLTWDTLAIMVIAPVFLSLVGGLIGGVLADRARDEWIDLPLSVRVPWGITHGALLGFIVLLLTSLVSSVVPPGNVNWQALVLLPILGSGVGAAAGAISIAVLPRLGRTR